MSRRCECALRRIEEAFTFFSRVDGDLLRRALLLIDDDLLLLRLLNLLGGDHFERLTTRLLRSWCRLGWVCL